MFCLYEQVEHGGGRKVKPSINNANAVSKEQSLSVSKNIEEQLGHFHVADDKLPLTFRLMKVRGLPEWANTSCVSIDDVIEVIFDCELHTSLYVCLAIPLAQATLFKGFQKSIKDVPSLEFFMIKLNI